MRVPTPWGRGKGTGVTGKEGDRNRRKEVRGSWTVFHQPGNTHHLRLESETFEKLSEPFVRRGTKRASQRVPQSLK